MTTLEVTVENQSMLPNILKAIEMIKGVVTAKIQSDYGIVVQQEINSKQHSARINSLRGICKNLTEEQITEDDRLAYILSK